MTLNQAQGLWKEAGALWMRLYEVAYKTADTEIQTGRAIRILNKAEARQIRRREAYANIKYPQRMAKS